jgi:hypothetical protein
MIALVMNEKRGEHEAHKQEIAEQIFYDLVSFARFRHQEKFPLRRMANLAVDSVDAFAFLLEREGGRGREEQELMVTRFAQSLYQIAVDIIVKLHSKEDLKKVKNKLRVMSESDTSNNLCNLYEQKIFDIIKAYGERNNNSDSQ